MPSSLDRGAGGLPAGLPLCVDLDGTLIRTDSLVEQFAALLRRPMSALRAVGALAKGRAAFKDRIAESANTDGAAWPYHEGVLELVRAEKAKGHRIVLATASHRATADGVAAHLGLFDEVMASDGATNLKGRRKADALVARFGEGGFVYAGDSRADLPVWRRSGGAVLVGTSRSVRRALNDAVPIVAEFPRPSRLRGLVKLLRPHQWAKNALVFAPLVAQGELTAARILAAGIAFVAFSLVASSLYVWNDLLDATADRAHPRKRKRPLASGVIPVKAAFVILPVLLVAGSAIGAQVGLIPMLVLYALGSGSYSMVLKTFPLLDIFTLGALYTIRLVAGGIATQIQPSVWLIGVSSFLFLGLAAMKRVGELERNADDAMQASRRGYSSRDVKLLEQIGISSAFASTVVLALYVQSPNATTAYAEPELLWMLVPLLLFWECRLWLATGRGFMHDDPVVYSLRDWVSWLVAVGMAITLLGARFWMF